MSVTEIPASLEPLLRRASLLESVNGQWSEANAAELPPLDRARVQYDASFALEQKVPWYLGAVALMLGGQEITPDQRVWLTARATNPAEAPREGTVGEVLEQRLSGIEVADGDRRLRIEQTFAQCRSDKLNRLLVLLRFEQAERVWFLRSEVGNPDPVSYRRRARSGWRDAIDTQLRALLASSLEQPVHENAWDFISGLGDTVTPDVAPGTLAHWLGTRGGELLSAGPIARAEVRRDVFEAYVKDVRIGDRRDGAAIGGLLHVQKRRGDQLLDAAEMGHMLYPLEADAFDRPAPTDETNAVAFVDVWRTAMSAYLETLVKELRPNLFTLVSTGPVFIGDGLFLMAKWLEHGPPSNAPAVAAGPKRKPALSVSKKTIEKAARSVRHLEADELDALRKNVDPQVAAGLAFDEWLVLLCPDHRSPPGTFGDDCILLKRGDQAPVEILQNDPWNGHYMPLDGDAETFRTVARFLREIVRDSPSDIDIAWHDEDLPLSAWLEFANPHPSIPPPIVDPRFQESSTATGMDFIADFSFWNPGNVFGIAADERERYRTAVDATYHAFLRAVIDPKFPRRDLQPIAG